MAKIRNVVFDVGNVLIGFRSMDMLRDHGLDEERSKEFTRCIFMDSLWKEFDLENMSFEEVGRAYMDKYPKLAADVRWLMDHSELMAVPRPDVWEKVRELKKAGYRLYILSNYSSVFFAKHTQGATFLEDMDGKVISCELHVIKPDEGIYRALLNRYGLKADECIFFDDLAENVDAAIRIGMQSVQIRSKEQLLGELDRLLDAANAEE